MIVSQSSYTSCVRNSEKITWRLDDLLPVEQRLDFSRPFLPESLTQTERMGFLSSSERLALNQITSNSYLNIFAFAEEFILFLVLDQAKRAHDPQGETDRLRALTRFIDEETKHQQLFKRYCHMFARDFGFECSVLENANEVAAFIMTKSPIAVLLLTLHIELTTQKHFTECVRGNLDLDPLFASVLKHHWLEEAHHAQIDTLELEREVARVSKEELDQAVDEYFELCDALGGLLRNQAAMDADSLVNVTGRQLGEAERDEVVHGQTRAYWEMLLACGMLHPKFETICRGIAPSMPERLHAWVGGHFPELVTRAA